MSVTTAELLQKVQSVLEQECASKAEALLQDTETRLVDGAPTREEVRDLLPTLTARLVNSTRTGKRIFGLDQLIAKLGQLDPSVVVIGYGFIAPKVAGNVYLADESGEAFGAAIVDL
ncbi:hypothetical protein [Hydrogenophaga sp. T2]|uniref:hypothetical protein n=1 Tax=Hydrogenophaga sp. T2 TaxID=3132823 RepID=UPI003CEBF250